MKNRAASVGRHGLGPRPATCSKLLVLVLAAGSVAFGACGDDGNLLGFENSAGSAGQAGGGSPDAGSTAGGAHAGMEASGGSNSTGGSNRAGGSNNTGGASVGAAGAGGATCETGSCVRANVCLDECGGDVLYTGCCACPAGTIEQLSCSTSGGQGSGGQGSAECVGKTCAANQTCVAYRTIGGAVFPPDAQGSCETGRHLEGAYCQPDFGYTCAELTGCAAPAATCRCAPNTQCANSNVCRLPNDAAWLDASADLVCEQQAP